MHPLDFAVEDERRVRRARQTERTLYLLERVHIGALLARMVHDNDGDVELACDLLKPLDCGTVRVIEPLLRASQGPELCKNINVYEARFFLNGRR